MRKLIVMRGLPGMGKSTWIKEHHLEDYTISPDALRFFYGAPQLLEDGSLSPAKDAGDLAWKTMLEALEMRLEKGAFTVIDATHMKEEYLVSYKKLAKKYRCRMLVVDFMTEDLMRDVALAKERNALRRGTSRFVPERAIERMASYPPLKGSYNKIAADDEASLTAFLRLDPLSIAKYKKTVFLGDIHGCMSAMAQYFAEKPFSDDNYYVFLGDSFDRGLENAQVFLFLEGLQDKKNVLFLEGNHEQQLRRRLAGERARSYLDATFEEFRAAKISDRRLRSFCDHLAQAAFLENGPRRILATHAGIGPLWASFRGEEAKDMGAKLPFLDADAFICGTGSYSDVEKVADAWADYCGKEGGAVQVFGHRNRGKLPACLNRWCYLLDDNVEEPLNEEGTFRVLEYDTDRDVFEVFSYKNPLWKKGFEDLEHPEVKLLVNQLRSPFMKDIIKETPLHDGISSFNFTRTAFTNRKWDGLTVRARGLFIDTEESRIVARSYDKFFNWNERPETTPAQLAKNLVYPVEGFGKENGFLGILAFDEKSGGLFFASKSLDEKTVPDPSALSYAGLFREVFEGMTDDMGRRKIADFLKDNNVSMVFEVESKKDRHVIGYSSDRAVLLDIIPNEAKFSLGRWKDYDTLVKEAKDLGLPVKKRVGVFYSWQELSGFLRERSLENVRESRWGEGFVFRDADNFMFKFKTNYYLFWKACRYQLQVSPAGHLPEMFGALKILERDPDRFPPEVRRDFQSRYEDFRLFAEEWRQSHGIAEDDRLLAPLGKEGRWSIVEIRQAFEESRFNR